MKQYKIKKKVVKTNVREGEREQMEEEQMRLWQAETGSTGVAYGAVHAEQSEMCTP